MDTKGRTTPRPGRHAIVGTSLLLFVLAACQAELPSADTGEQASVNAAVPNTATSTLTGLADSTGRQVQPQAGNGISVRCADAEVRIGAEADLRLRQGQIQGDPSASQIELLHGQEKVANVPIPSEMEGYEPVALGCAIAKTDHRAYFVVQYGERPYGCSFCEWFFLYDVHGQQLTHSSPPVLEDKALPPVQRQYPNNNEYEAMIRDLGIDQPEMTAIE